MNIRLSPFRSVLRYPAYLLNRKNIALALVWPIMAALVIGGLWWVLEGQLQERKNATLAAGFARANALANAYASQVRQTVEQIDQLTLNLKDDWEDPNSHVDLEKKRAHGLYPEDALLYATIFNANGDIVTSSLSTVAKPNGANHGFFQALKSGCCNGLLISQPEIGRRVKRPVIHFSRRLERGGRFAGTAMVAIEPPYLVSFQDEGLSGQDGFISVRLTSGPLLATRVGHSAANFRIFYRNNPIFHRPSGVVREPGNKFKDSQTRIVAWQKLSHYPLVTLAALSQASVLAPYETMARTYRQMATLVSLMIAAFALSAMIFSLRLAWRRAQAEQVRATYRIATDAANEGFYILRPHYDAHQQLTDFILDDCNERGAALIGATPSTLVGRYGSSILSKHALDAVLTLCRQALDRGAAEDEFRVPYLSGIRAQWIYRRAVRSGTALAVTIRDISEAKAHESTLVRIANSDALTTLPNRHWLTTYLPQAIARAASSISHLAVLFIDLDNFKNINDTLGHEAGDQLLCQAAQRLKNTVRHGDHIVRLGGDEFTVILEKLEGEEDIAHVARHIIDVLGQTFELFGTSLNQVHASIGISIFPQDGTDSETLLKHADIAMYAAKTAGKGRYQFYQPHLSDSLMKRLHKEHMLKSAVEHDEFVIHYQPRVGLESGRLSSMEALVRWQPPEGKLVYPGEFIEVAEEAGLIVRLGELVIDKVCAQLAQWQAQGLPMIPVSVNISPQQLQYGNVSTYLANCIARYGIKPFLIEAELTESAVIDHSQTVTRELEQLRTLGVKLMIDDFGTGYSSLAQLQRLDVDVLKVDQAFTRALVRGTEGEALFRAIVSMAEALKICVVAEGVETLEQLEILSMLSCNEIQGYLVSKALPPVEMTRLMLQGPIIAWTTAKRYFAPLQSQLVH